MPCDQGNEASWIRDVKTSEPIKLFDQGKFKYKSNQAKNKYGRRSKDLEKISDISQTKQTEGSFIFHEVGGELVVFGSGHARKKWLSGGGGAKISIKKGGHVKYFTKTLKWQ